jgi:hypothetical protein
MRTEIYDLSNNLVSRIVQSTIEPDVNKITKRLLDGSYHTQNIGSAMTKAKITCYVTPTNKDKIDNLYITDEYVRLFKDGKSYTGRITEKSEWKEIVRGKYFEVSFVLVVNP